MGTNYYARPDACEHCGRADYELHIGKSSAGWRFNLRAHVDPEIASWADWKSYLSENRPRIFDEYGQEHSVESLIAWVESKRDGSNHADLYPRDGTFKDGDGWPLSYGEFS